MSVTWHNSLNVTSLDQPKALRGRDVEQRHPHVSKDSIKVKQAALFLSQMNAKLKTTVIGDGKTPVPNLMISSTN